MQAKDLKPNSWYITGDPEKTYMDGTPVYVARTDRYSYNHHQGIWHSPDAKLGGHGARWSLTHVGYLIFTPYFDAEDLKLVRAWLRDGGEAPEAAVRFAKAADEIHNVIIEDGKHVLLTNLPELPFQGSSVVDRLGKLSPPARFFAARAEAVAGEQKAQDHRAEALRRHQEALDKLKATAEAADFLLARVAYPEKSGWGDGYTTEQRAWNSEVKMSMGTLHDLLRRLADKEK